MSNDAIGGRMVLSPVCTDDNEVDCNGVFFFLADEVGKQWEQRKEENKTDEIRGATWETRFGALRTRDTGSGTMVARALGRWGAGAASAADRDKEGNPHGPHPST